MLPFFKSLQEWELMPHSCGMDQVVDLKRRNYILLHSSQGSFKLYCLLSYFFLVYQITGNHLLSWQPGNSHFSFELIYFSSIVIIEKYSSVLYAQQRAAKCNKVLATSALLVFIFLGLIYGGIVKVNLDIVALYCIISFFPALMLLIYYHRQGGKLFARFGREDLISFYNFSLIVFITNLVQFVAYRADFWLIDYFRNTEQVGVYAQANRFAQLLWVIPNILAGILAPVIAKGFMSRSLMLIISRIISFTNLFLMAVVAIISWFFYQYFLGKDFSAGFKTLFLMMPGYYFFCLNILFAAWFSAKRLLWINFAGSSICLFLVLLFDWLLIPHLGINGAAIANTVAYSAAGFFHAAMFMRVTKTTLGEFLKFKKRDRFNPVEIAVSALEKYSYSTVGQQYSAIYSRVNSFTK